jgi:cyclic pyranopterin phosphate synthase
MRKENLLTYEEIERLVRVFVSLGVRNVRLTGGEPLMRKDLSKLVHMLRRVPLVDDIAMTTNGYFLKEQLQDLVTAGLGRINVSLDALDPSIFSNVVRRGFSAKTWEGIEEAERLGIHPIKLNVVLIRGVNESEILRFARLAQTRQFIVRFIEFMPIGKDDGWTRDKVVPTSEVLQRIQEYAALAPIPKDGQHVPEQRYAFEDGKGELGCISSVSEPFCRDCNRVRLTSDGKLRTCLFSLYETDLRALLRGGATDKDVANAITTAVWNKEEGHLINQPGFTRPHRTMSQIGG